MSDIDSGFRGLDPRLKATQPKIMKESTRTLIKDRVLNLLESMSFACSVAEHEIPEYFARHSFVISMLSTLLKVGLSTAQYDLRSQRALAYGVLGSCEGCSNCL